jgi:hypothetical protein
MDTLGWRVDYLVELMDGLIQSKTAGHQYLTDYPKDDAIIVVSKGEYSDALLQADWWRKLSNVRLAWSSGSPQSRNFDK